MNRGATLVVVMMAVVSCGDLLKKKDQDAGDTANPTAPVNGTPVPAQPVLAVNQGDIARYPDESPLPTPTKLAFQRGFNIRESIPNGKVITGLSKGVIATQIAKRHPYILITFDSPTTPGTPMMGWVHQDAFALVVADAGVLTCAAGETPLFSDVPTCGKVCTANTDCAANFQCTGQSNKLAAGNKPGDPVKVCVAAPPAPVADAGGNAPPPPPVDAGKPAPVADAGKPNSGEPGNGIDEVNALPGKTCPGSFVYLAKTGHCHRPCKDANGANLCAAVHFCSTCEGKALCTNQRGICK